MTCVMCPRTDLMTRDIDWIQADTFEAVLDQMEPNSPEDLEQFWQFIKDQYGITFDERSENAFYFYVLSRCVILHGYGEPLIDKNITARVQACTDRNIPTYFSCVPANISVERARSVMDAGLTVLKFSLDGLTDELQKKVRGRLNNFDKSYETILEILELKKANNYKTLIVPTMIALAADGQAKIMHQEFIELWKSHDVFAYVKSQDNRWYYEGDENIENRSHYHNQYCEYPWTSLTVMADGSVVPCTQDYDCEMKMGNVKDNSIEEIWNGTKYQKLRQAHLTGQFTKGFKCAERCDQIKLHQLLK